MLRAHVISIVTASIGFAGVCRADIIVGDYGGGAPSSAAATRRYRESDGGSAWGHNTFFESLEGVTVGADGSEYDLGNNVGSAAIRRYHPTTGAFASTVLTGSENNGFEVPSGLTMIGGNLYSTSRKFSAVGIDGVVRINATTGAVTAMSIAAGNNGLGEPNDVFRTPGNALLVSDGLRINRYNATTGAFLGTFVTTGNGVTQLGRSAFGPDGNFYVCDFADKLVARYDGTSGAYLGNVITGQSIPSITFGNDGQLYALVGHASGPATIDRYNPTTGAFVDKFQTITADAFQRSPVFLTTAPNTPEPAGFAVIAMFGAGALLRRSRKNFQMEGCK